MIYYIYPKAHPLGSVTWDKWTNKFLLWQEYSLGDGNHLWKHTELSTTEIIKWDLTGRELQACKRESMHEGWLEQVDAYYEVLSEKLSEESKSAWQKRSEFMSELEKS